MKTEVNYQFNQREFLSESGTEAVAGTVSTFGDDPSYIEASLSLSDNSQHAHLDLSVFDRTEGEQQLAKLDRIVGVINGVRSALAAKVAETEAFHRDGE